MDRQHSQRIPTKVSKSESDDGFPVPKHKAGERFVRGPIPYEWLRLALNIGNKTGNLALAIWFLVGVKGSNPILLTPHVLKDFSISPRSARRILSQLETAGLIRMDRKRGRSPLITLLDLKQKESRNG